jgi:hemerythrin-like domain-containing protein
MSSVTTRADVTMMYLIHDAIRRDLDRLEDGLHRLASMHAGPARRALIGALERCWTDFDHHLHQHHTVEDNRLWPVLRKVCPMTGELLEDMEAEHAAIDPLVRECRTVMAQALTPYPTFEDASRAADAVGGLRGELRAHLEHEEFGALPYIVDHLGSRWDEFEERQRKDAGVAGLTRFMPWVLDEADPVRADWLRDRLPAAVFALVSRVFLRRRQRALAPLTDA